jgi:hypothetical protein
VAVAGLSRRAIAIVVAIILAIVATIALVSYIRGIEQEALRDVEAVEVFVARESIPEGMSGDEASEEGLIERETVPRTLVPEGAITSLEEVQGRVANTTVLQGEVISRGRFVAPGEVRALLPIPEDRQAIWRRLLDMGRDEAFAIETVAFDLESAANAWAAQAGSPTPKCSALSTRRRERHHRWHTVNASPHPGLLNTRACDAPSFTAAGE